MIAPAVEQHAFAVDPLVVEAEHRAFAGLERHDEADAVAIFRHMADPDQALQPRRALDWRQDLAVEEDFAGAERAHAGERLEKLRLAVAGHARDAEDLARAQGEGDAVDANHAPVVTHHEVARLERDSARMGRPLVDLQDHLAPDHRVGELRRRGLVGVEGRDHFAAPHHRDAVGETS